MRVSKGFLVGLVVSSLLATNLNLYSGAYAATVTSLTPQSPTDLGSSDSTSSAKVTITSCNDLLNKLKNPSVTFQPAKVIKCQEGLEDNISQPNHRVTYMKGIAAVVEFLPTPYFDKQAGTIADYQKSGKTVFAPCADTYCSKIVGTTPYSKNINSGYWIGSAPAYFSNLSFIEPNQNVIGADSCNENNITTYKFTDTLNKQTVGFDCSSIFTSSGYFAGYDYIRGIWEKSHDQGQMIRQYLLGFSVNTISPDYVITGSPKIQVTSKTGVSSGWLDSSATVSADTKSIEIKGLSVKNIGTAPSKSDSTIMVQLSAGGSMVSFVTLAVGSLNAGSSQDLDVIGNVDRVEISSLLLNAAKYSTNNEVIIRLTADYQNKVNELNEFNNEYNFRSAVNFTGLRIITVDSAGREVSSDIKIETSGEKAVMDEKTDAYGLFALAPLNDPSMKIAYYVQSFTNGLSTSDKKSVTIDKASIFELKLVIDGRNLPDIILNGSQASIMVGTTDNKFEEYKFSEDRAISFGSDVSFLYVSGFSIKNIGNADLPVNSLESISLILNSSSKLGIIGKDKLPQTVISVGEETKISPFKIDKEGIEVIKSFLQTQAPPNDGLFSLSFSINTNAGVIESRNDNNVFESQAKLGIIALVVNVLDSSGYSVNNLVVKVADDDLLSSDPNKTISSITGSNGAIFVPVGSLISVESRKYTITLSLGEESSFLKTNISSIGIYRYKFNIPDGLLVIQASVSKASGFDREVYEPATGGTVNLAFLSSADPTGRSVDRIFKLSAEVVNGIAIFSAKKFPNMVDGMYRITNSTATGEQTIILNRSNNSSSPELSANKVTTYNWPESSQGEKLSSGKVFAYKSTGETQIYELRMKYAKYCEKDSDTGINICWLDDVRARDFSKRNIWPVVKNEVLRLMNFSDYPLRDLYSVTFVTQGESSGWLGLYNNANKILLSSSLTNAEIELLGAGGSSYVKTIIDHEMFHHLDHYYGSGAYLSLNMLDYSANLYQELNNNSGKPFWDLTSYNCTYAQYCTAGYNASAFTKTERPVIEAFAEEMSTVCTYGSKVTDRVNNLSNSWESLTSSQKPENINELISNLLARISGKRSDGSIYSEHIKAWNIQCLATAQK